MTAEETMRNVVYIAAPAVPVAMSVKRFMNAVCALLEFQQKWPIFIVACRLEEINEKRQGMVQRLKIVEKERDALETEKVAAEAYLAKQRESLECQRMIFHVFVKDGQVYLTDDLQCSASTWKKCFMSIDRNMLCAQICACCCLILLLSHRPGLTLFAQTCS